MANILKENEAVTLQEKKEKVALVGLSQQEIEQSLKTLGIPEKQLRMRTCQLWSWIYVRGVSDFLLMSDLSMELRKLFIAHYTLERPKIVSQQISSDGTRKWLLEFPAKGAGRPVQAETVYIPDDGRGTLCLSSQVGCTLTCSFCYTGTQKLVRNLSAEEILMQIIVARSCLDDFTKTNQKRESFEHNRKVTNIVMMGMGEPLYNFNEVKKSLLIASSGEGLSLSKRRITVSTSGVVPMIERIGSEIGVMLAVSLHAVTDELRNELVPINKKFPIASLLEACKNYPGLTNARRITFEYVMLKDVNDRLEDARKLVELLRSIPSKINLIPFNPWPGSAYKTSTWEAIKSFSEILSNAGFPCPVRMPRGRDIMAACGQLKSLSERMRKTEREKTLPFVS